MTPDPRRYEKIAAFLAERMLAVQAAKTAAGEKSHWDRLRPENPDRPGANWWTGLGGGAMAAGAEIGIGRHGLTDTVRRQVDRRELRNNPFARLGNGEFQKSLASDEQTQLLREIFRRRETETGGRRAVGTLLAKYYGTQNVADPAHVARLHGELRGFVDPNDTDLLRKMTESVSSPHPANARTGKDILRQLDGLLGGGTLGDRERHLLTKFRTGIGPVESADRLEALTKGLRNLGASISGGKKGSPAQLVFGSDARKLIDGLAASPIERGLVEDPNKVKKLVSAFGQFTKGRAVPSFMRRFGRAGTAAGIGTAVGAYALPSLLDLGKWAVGGTEPKK